MKISELIIELENIKKFKGDLPVFTHSEHGISEPKELTISDLFDGKAFCACDTEYLSISDNDEICYIGEL